MSEQQPESKIIELNIPSFFEMVQKEELVLVDFYAIWCPSCMSQGKIMDEEGHKLIEQFPKLKLTKFNVDNDGGISNQLYIKYIPTIFVVYKKVMGKMESCLKTIDEISKFITKFIKDTDSKTEITKEMTIDILHVPEPPKPKKERKPKKQK